MFTYTDGKMYAQVYGDTSGCKGDYETVNMLDGCQSGSEEHEGYSSQWYVCVRSETNLGGTCVLCRSHHPVFPGPPLCVMRRFHADTLDFAASLDATSTTTTTRNNNKAKRAKKTH